MVSLPLHSSHSMSYSAEPIMHIVWVIKVSNPVFFRLLGGLTLIQVYGKGTFFDQLEEVGWASSSWPHSEPDKLLSASFWSISEVMILFVVVCFFSLFLSLCPSIHPPTIHHLSSTWNKRNQSSLKSTFKRILEPLRGFPGGSDGKASACNAGDSRFDPWVGKILWRRKWQPIPVLLPGKFHGWRSLVGYSPWGHKELDMTQQPDFLSFFL